MKCKNIKECFLADIRRLNPEIGLVEVFFRCVYESGTLAVILFRLSQYIYEKKIVWRMSKYINRINQMINGFECNILSKIDVGLFVPHSMNIVIGITQIGKNMTIYNGVTIGARAMKNSDREYKEGQNRYPVIGNNVVIYSGAKLIGPIKIGQNSVVGANAVVLSNIPAYKTAVGNPARMID